MDQLHRLGKSELICLLLFTCNYVVSVLIGFPFLWVPGMGYVILLWHSLSLPYNYFENYECTIYGCKSFLLERPAIAFYTDMQIMLLVSLRQQSKNTRN